MGKLVDLTGQRFGRLTVIERVGTSKNGKATWLCQCDCGNSTVVEGTALRIENTKSCGCFHNENLRARSITHEKTEYRLYGVWKTMKTRCYNSHSNRYKHYGGRGITVCDEWLHDFQAFYDWAMANGYDPTAPRGACTIDRIDVNGNYCPENCRWVSMAVQSKNKQK